MKLYFMHFLSHNTKTKMQYNNPFISNDFEASTYYFYSDFQNNNNIIIPLFVRPTLNNILTNIGAIFNQMVYFLKNIYLLFTFGSIDGDIYFTKIKNIIQNIITNISNNISSSNYTYPISSFHKILLRVICLYWIITLIHFAYTYINSFYEREQRLEQRIIELEKKVSLLNQKHHHLENEMKQIFCVSSNIK